MSSPPPKTKFQLRREATYGQLLEAGMAEFAERGYSAARVDDIAARTGQTKGAFYFHFRNKLDLLQHIHRERDARRAGWLQVAREIPSSATLEEVIGASLADINRRVPGGPWVMVMADAYHRHRGEPEFAAGLAAAYDRWVGELTEFVGILRERGWTASTLPDREMAMQLFALGEGFEVHGRLYDNPPFDARLRAMANLLR